MALGAWFIAVVGQCGSNTETHRFGVDLLVKLKQGRPISFKFKVVAKQGSEGCHQRSLAKISARSAISLWRAGAG